MKKLLMLLLIFLFISSCQNAHVINSASLRSIGKNIDSIKLYSLDGKKKYLLKNLYRDKDAIVLFFWQNHCPCVKRYQARMIEIYNKFSSKKIGFYLIASKSSDTDKETFEEYNKRNIPIPILRDRHAKLAKALMVNGTPSSVLISKNSEVKFIGWIDNERDIGDTKRVFFLENALNQFLNDQKISDPTSPMFGCSIY